MDQITIIIPTRNRLQKLVRCLQSIPDHPGLKVIVGCDGDFTTAQALETGLAPFQKVDLVLWTRENIGSLAICNMMAPMIPDGLLPLCDDMELKPGAIEAALEVFNRLYSDDDGVVGFAQEGIPSFGPTAVSLIGRRFLDRYPGRRLFYPGYRHYGDQEIFLLADSLGKFHHEPAAVVYHYHPGIHKIESDQTHQETQMCKEKDQELAKKRREAGLIWGKPENEETKGLTRPPRDRAIKQEEVTTK